MSEVGYAVVGLHLASGVPPELDAEIADLSATRVSHGSGSLLLVHDARDALWLGRRLARAAPRAAVAIAAGRTVERGGALVGRGVEECIDLLARCRGGQTLVTASILELDPAAEAEASPLGGPSAGGGPSAFELAHPSGGDSLRSTIPEALAIADDSAFFGRERELHALERAWERSVAGERAPALISGEPGAGKTRLLARLAAELAPRGAIVLYGRCTEESGSALAPIAEALANAGMPLDLPASDLLRADGNAVPHMDASEPGLRAAVTERFVAIATRGPLLLLIDDLQWADSETIRTLIHLLDTEEEIRGLAVNTLRTSEVDEGSPLGLALQRVRRRPGVVERQLGGLDAAALSGLAGSLLGSETVVSDSFVATLRSESGGNPLFATELLRTLVETDAIDVPSGRAGRWTSSLPATVNETIRQRVDRLGVDAVEALTVASLCGTEFELDLLGRVLEGPAQERLEATLREAEHAGLLSPRRGDALRFSHGMVAQSLAERCGAASRARIHRRIAEALEAMGETRAAGSTEDLARHWLAASPPDHARAVDCCERAGREALEGFRSSVALELYGAALRLHGETDDARRCRLLLGRGLAQLQSGQPQFRETLLDAARLADSLGEIDLLTASVLANHRGFVSASGAVDPERVAMLDAALARAADDATAPPLLLATLAAELSFSGEERRFALSDQAVALARAGGDEATLGSVLVSRFVTIWTPETLAERLVNSAESVEIADRVGDPLLQFRAVHWRSVALIQAGEVAAGAEMIARQDQLASRYGDPVSKWIARYDRSNLAIIEGRLEQAEALAGEALELATSSSQPDAIPFYGSQLANIRYEQGRLGELQGLLGQVVADNPGIPGFRAVLALACVEGELRDQASQLLDAEAADGFERIPRDLVWLAAHTIYAHVCADLGNAAAAATLYERLEPFADQLVYTGISAWGVVEHALGRLGGVLEMADAQERMERSCARYAAMGAPVWLARGRLGWARLKLASGDRGERSSALELLDSVVTEAHSLGAAAVERRAIALRESAKASDVFAGVSLRARPAAAPRKDRRRTDGDAALVPSLSLEGDVWRIESGGSTLRIRDSVGFRYLAQLLANPGVEFGAAELQAGPSAPADGALPDVAGVTARGPAGEIGGPMLDQRAKDHYRQRIEELRSELDEAERFNDPERAEGLRTELDALLGELRSAVGLGGRDRRMSSAGERARVNVTRALRRAIGRIAEADPELGDRLDRSIRTGISCVYYPADRELGDWDVRMKARV